MTLKRLSIQHLRNLGSVDLLLDDRVNLIFGENGSGKTSILEAINILALGRSFRSHKHKPLIQHNKSSFTVFGKVVSDGDGLAGDIPIGVSREQDGSASFKVGGEGVASAAELATYLPLQVINADTFMLLEGSPAVRRQFIDWLVFHVEHQFYAVWKEWQRCLKHRNSLLRRDRIDPFELAPWDAELAKLTDQIHSFRQSIMDKLILVFQELITEFNLAEGIGIRYFPGWDTTQSYSELLFATRDRDVELGYTFSGAHRAELRITLDGRNAAEILSRGQQKLLVCALKIAQGVMYTRLTGRKTIYLVDDLPAELDEKHRKLLVSWLSKMDTQVFVTGVDRQTLEAIWEESPELTKKMFHVEQGRVSRVDDSSPLTAL